MAALRITIFIVFVACGAPTKIGGPVTVPPEQNIEVADASDWILSPDQDATRFRNHEGIRVYLVPVRSKSIPALRNHYLLRLTGTQSQYDGLVVVVRRVDFGNHVSYIAQLEGQPSIFLQFRKPSNLAPERPRWNLRGYESHNNYGLVELIATAFDANAVIKLREEQQMLPISKFETTSRDAIVRAQNKRFQKQIGGGRYRVFVGRKGELKLTKLVRLVEDSRGTLFSTDRGDLRLVVEGRTLTGVWINKKKTKSLCSVRLANSRKLIYDDLGVYYGETLGFACD